MSQAINNFLGTTGFAKLFSEPNWWQYIAMYVIIGALFYLAIVKKFEPLLLMPIAFGMLLANLPGAELIHLEYFFDEYYISTEGTALTGTLSAHMENFLSMLNSNGFSSLFSITEENGLRFHFENLDANTIEYINSQFSYYLGDAAYINDGIVHITMAHMVKEVINHGGLIDILYLGPSLQACQPGCCR